ncbi:MAG: nuclear transport factor 2 family protein [Bacteroidota bacterium]
MRIILFILIGFCTFCAKSQNDKSQDDKSQILAQAKKFSAYLMSGERDKIVQLYTKDAKIFPTGKDILDGPKLAEYWNPTSRTASKTLYHKLTPVEIKIWGAEAYDYGYYEGRSTNGKQNFKWKGKYVVIWKKEAGVWKMHLDIWNAVEE